MHRRAVMLGGCLPIHMTNVVTRPLTTGHYHTPVDLQWMFSQIFNDTQFLSSFLQKNRSRMAHSYELLTGASCFAPGWVTMWGMGSIDAWPCFQQIVDS